MINTKTRLFNISSINSQDTTKNKVLIDLPNLNFENLNIQNVYFSVIHAEVPNSFYVINENNNTLVINSITYTVDNGNYNANTLITKLLLILPVGFSITYSSITNKYTFTNTSSFIINSVSTIKNVIGLADDDISSVLNIIVMPHPVNFIPVPRINYKSNYFNFGNFNLSDKTGDLFLSLQNAVLQNSMNNYINHTNIRFQVDFHNITSFIINITDDLGNYINFNNQDWYLTFQIDIDYLVNINKMITFNNLIPK